MKRYLNCFRSGGRRTASASGLKELLQTWNPPVRVADDVQFSSICPSNRPNKDETLAADVRFSPPPLILFTPNNRVIDGEEFLTKITNQTTSKLSTSKRIETNFCSNIYLKYYFNDPCLKSSTQWKKSRDDITELLISKNEICLSFVWKTRVEKKRTGMVESNWLRVYDDK